MHQLVIERILDRFEARRPIESNPNYRSLYLVVPKLRTSAFLLGIFKILGAEGGYEFIYYQNHQSC